MEETIKRYCIQINIYAYTYIHIYIHTHIHAYINTHTTHLACSCASLWQPAEIARNNSDHSACSEARSRAEGGTVGCKGLPRLVPGILFRAVRDARDCLRFA